MIYVTPYARKPEVGECVRHTGGVWHKVRAVKDHEIIPICGRIIRYRIDTRYPEHNITSDPKGEPVCCRCAGRPNITKKHYRRALQEIMDLPDTAALETAKAIAKTLL